MSKTLEQVYVTNPITTNQSTDLMYFARSPYSATDDCGMTYANFALQFGAPYTAAALTAGNDTNVTLTLGGTPATALLHAASITAGWTGQLSAARGGTGVNNGVNTATFAGSLNFANSFTTSGNFAVTQTYTGITNVTFPTSGTLATTSQLPTPAALTEVNDTNVTMTLGGTPNTALLQAVSMTLGWTGQLSLARGGSNASLTASNGGIIYSDASAMAVLAGTPTANQILVSGANSAPSWSTATFPSTAGAAGTVLRSNGTNWVASTSTFADTYAVSTLLYASSANGVTGLATTNRASLSTNATGVPTWLALTDGQVVVGSTAGAPAAATLTAGTGVSITNASNSITIASTGVGSLVWNDVSGTSQAAAVNQGYIISNASLTTVTLPATAAEGSTFAIAGKGAAGWVLQANTGQTIHYGSSPTSSAGSLASTNQWDSVTIVCVTANTTFSVIASQGALTVA